MSDTSFLRKLTQRIAGTFLVRGLVAVAALATAAMIIRGYSLHVFGEYSFSIATVRLISAFSTFSLDSLLLRVLLRSDQRSNSVVVERVERECVGFGMLIAIAAMTLTASLAAGMMMANPGASFWLSLLILSPIVPLQTAAALQAARLRADRRDTAAQMLTVGIAGLLPLPFLALPLLSSFSLRYLPEASALLAYVVAAAIGKRWIGNAFRGHLRHCISGPLRGRLRVVRYSWAIHSANMMNYLTEWYGGMLLSLTQSFAVVGVLRIFQQFGQIFALVSISIEAPLATEIAKAQVRRDFRRVSMLLHASQLALGLLGLAIFGCIALTSDLIFAFFEMDPKAHAAAFLVFILLQTAKMFTGAAASALNMMNGAHRLIRASAIALVVGLLLQSALIPFFGLLGATIGIGVVVLVRGLANLHYVRKSIRQGS